MEGFLRLLYLQTLPIEGNTHERESMRERERERDRERDYLVKTWYGLKDILTEEIL